MIRVEFLVRGSTLLGFTSEGHAGIADQGEDILCSAVSSLLYAVNNTLHARGASLHSEVDVERGWLKVLLLSGADQPELQAILQVAQVGIQDLADLYEQHVSIKIKEK